MEESNITEKAEETQHVDKLVSAEHLCVLSVSVLRLFRNSTGYLSTGETGNRLGQSGPDKLATPASIWLFTAKGM